MIHRIAVPGAVLSLDLLDRIDYGDAFEARTSESRTPREWGERIIERASPEILGVVLALHARVGRMRLAPPGPEHPLGWHILEETDSHFVMGTEGGIVTPRVVILTTPGRVVFSTVLRYETHSARPIWAVGRHVHRAVARYLVAGAVRPERGTASAPRAMDGSGHERR
jgi:hypothetical protein